MINNNDVRNLYVFLMQKVDLKELMHDCTEKGDTRISHFTGNYLDALLGEAYKKRIASRVSLPAVDGPYSFRRDKTGSVHVREDNKQFTTFDRLVKANEVPVLVEMRTTSATAMVKKYFEKSPNKTMALSRLYSDDFGWILMLPLEFSHREPQCLDTFKQGGGMTAILPYTSKEMQAAIYQQERQKSQH